MFLPTAICFRDLLNHWMGSDKEITVTLQNGLAIVGKVEQSCLIDGFVPQVQMVRKASGSKCTRTWFVLDHVMSVSVTE